MIGQIRGKLIGRQAPEILVEVGGIGYEIQVPMTTLYQLPEIGQEVTLLTHFVVREDAQQLFGFIGAADRRLFRALIKVSGVGPRLALTLLSGMDAPEFARCMQRDDVTALVALPGVGRKTGRAFIGRDEGQSRRLAGRIISRGRIRQRARATLGNRSASRSGASISRVGVQVARGGKARRQH
jgi:Holliday junction DNA helicase RuvA subunit